jgi:hypothetical protein
MSHALRIRGSIVHRVLASVVGDWAERVLTISG